MTFKRILPSSSVRQSRSIFLVSAFLVLLLSATSTTRSTCSAFLSPMDFPVFSARLYLPSRLYYYNTVDERVPVGDMKEELESYGISTRYFLEKKEIMEALVKARKERVRAEATKRASKMSIGELKNELLDMGIRSWTFVEKSEFIHAYVDAIVQGKTKLDQFRDVTATKVEKNDPLISKSGFIDTVAVKM